MNMGPKVIHIVKCKVLTLVQSSASRMCTHHSFATSLGPLALNEMLVVKVIISDGWTSILESALFEKQPLVADAVWALLRLHEEWKLIEAGLTLTSASGDSGLTGGFAFILSMR